VSRYYSHGTKAKVGIKVVCTASNSCCGWSMDLDMSLTTIDQNYIILAQQEFVPCENSTREVEILYLAQQIV
jgi:hypothetical protein